MSSSSEDMIFVEEQRMTSLVDEYPDDSDADSYVSDDSAIYVINKQTTGGPLSMASAVEAASLTQGDPLEQRPDIQKTLQIPQLLLEQLTFKDEATLSDAIDRVGAREHLDRDIENEIANIEKISQNKQLMKENLQKACKTAIEHTLQAREIARDGQTTVKRAMEVIENALPVFVEACNKSYENNALNEQVMLEAEAYQESQKADKNAAFNIELQQQREDEGLQHLNTCIDLAESDMKRISEKQKNEVEQERLASFIKTKEEIEGIVSDEQGEVDEYLNSCEQDLKVIASLQEEQKLRFTKATNNYTIKDGNFETQIQANLKKQEALKAELKKVEKQCEELQDEREFQKKTQKKAKNVHDDIMAQLMHLEGAISDINARATTAKQVIESMEVCGSVLIDASIEGEREYIKTLEELVQEAKQRYRFALASSAVEKKIRIDNCFNNIEDYKEKMKCIQLDLQKAVQRRKVLDAKKEEENLKEHSREKKKEQKLKEDAEKALEELIERLTVIDGELREMGVEVSSVDELHELRQRELENLLAPSGDGYSSLELSDNDNDGE